MGDPRYARLYQRIRHAEDPSATARGLSDADLVHALAGASHEHDPRLVRVLEQEVVSRARVARAAMAHLDEGVYATDAAARITFLNAAASRMLGWSAEDAVGRDAVDVLGLRDAEGDPIPPDGYPDVEALRENGVVRRTDLRVTPRGGDPFRVDLTAAAVHDDGDVTGVVVVFRDARRSEPARSALEDARERFRRLVTDAPVMFWAVDENRVVTAMEGRGLAQIGVSVDEFVGETVAPRQRETGVRALVREGLRRALDGEVVEKEVQHGRKTYRSRFAPVRADGDIVGAMATLWDVTRERDGKRHVARLNAELRERMEKRTQELEAANRELEAFTHAASHDLRAPLRGMEALSTALLEDYGDVLDEPGQDALQGLRRESRRATALVNDLLNLSRVKRADFHRTRVDVTALARSVVSDMETRHPERRVDAHVQEELVAEADPRLLRIALTNLLDNAWKYTRNTPHPRVEVGATRVRRDGQACAFFVKDNGVGFDPSQADRLFEPFKRLHAATEYEGTGVGLTTVKRIMERHGGDVWAEGAPGEGATFYFSVAPPESPRRAH